MQIIQYDNQLLERIDAMYERRINEVKKFAAKSRIIGSVAVIIGIFLYLFVGAFFNLPDKIGGIVYGFILPVVIAVLCVFCFPVFFLKRKIKKTRMTGIYGIKVMK